MSKLRQEIGLHMSAFRSDGNGEVTASFSFPDGFSGFQGHFPDNPVLPGVCIIQAVLVMTERQGGAPVRLQEIKMSKFFSPVKPGQQVDFISRSQKEKSDRAALRASIHCGQEKVAELALVVGYEEGTAS